MTQYGEWLSKGYDSSTLDHRKLLVEKIAKYRPFYSLLDVGCSTGPDLALYEEAFPDTGLTGFDLGTGDIEIAKKLLASDTTILYAKDLREHLKEIPQKQFDIVVSNGVMMYHDMKYIDELLRITKKAVIMSEKDPYKGRSISEYLKSNGIRYETTKIDRGTRHSWADDGFIYEIPL